MIEICPQCGCEFDKKQKRKIFCSRSCKENHHNKAQKTWTGFVQKTCVQCGKEFEIAERQRACAKYCSKKCYNAKEEARRKELKKRGPKPGTVYKKRVEKVEKPKQIGVCVVCGVEYEKTQSVQFCCTPACSHKRNMEIQRDKRRLESQSEPKPEKERKFANTSRSSTGVVIKQPKSLPDSLFANCELCGKEYVKSVQANGKCPVCRGIYHIPRLHWNHNRMEI